MVLTIAAKRINGNWEAALIVDGRFARSFVNETITEIVSSGMVPLIATNTAEEGTEVTFNVEITTPPARA